jgi:hypothetical protein
MAASSSCVTLLYLPLRGDSPRLMRYRTVAAMPFPSTPHPKPVVLAFASHTEGEGRGGIQRERDARLGEGVVALPSSSIETPRRDFARQS